MGNGEWGVGNGEWGVGSGEWGIGNGYKEQDLRKFTFDPLSVGAQGLAPLPCVASVRKS